MKLQVALLAAGRSDRYGSNKLLAPHRRSRQPLLQHVLERYRQAGLFPIQVLTGCWHHPLQGALQDQPDIAVHYVTNWQEGIAASLREAAQLISANDESLLIGLGDQAGVTTELLQSLVNLYASRPVITATVCNGIISPPVIFPYHERAILQQLQGDKGAGKTLQQLADTAPERIQLLTVSSLIDIDCPDDWLKLD